ncbi:MAG: ATP-binding cassette domain-containing protein, partial [Clostridia bacterium]|nr:ATP-binding cassette domain-containing protein [Clostridia bacterium]
ALGRMLFSDEDMEKKISVLSGGERARLGFALMTMKSANFLIFDEPTNHVDLPTRESLEKALKEFDGTVLFVSHDRYFLSSLATKVVEIVDCNLQENEMGFSEYLKAKEAEKAKLEQARLDLEKEKAKTEQKSTYRGAKERAEEVKRRQQLKAAEEEIEKLELRNLEISSCMQTEEVASDYSKLKPLLDEMEQNKIKLDNLYLIWENLT